MKKNIVAIDIGYSNLKLGVFRGGEAQFKLLPSGVGPVEDYAKPLGAGELSGVEVRINDRDFIAAVAHQDIFTPGRIISENFSDSDDYKALFHAGLFHSKTEHIDVLVTGLPSYQIHDKDRVARIKKMMTGKHHVGARHITVNKVEVVPQPAGARASPPTTGSALRVVQPERTGPEILCPHHTHTLCKNLPFQFKNSEYPLHKAKALDLLYQGLRQGLGLASDAFCVSMGLGRSV